MKQFTIFILILYLALNVNSRKLCAGSTTCRDSFTLSNQCSYYNSFSTCRNWACEWRTEEGLCIPKKCENILKRPFCNMNFNCKWNTVRHECVRRQVIFKK